MKILDAESFLKQQTHISQAIIKKSNVFRFMGGALVIAQAWLIASSINDALFKGMTLSAIAPYLAGLLCVFIIRFALLCMADFYVVKAAVYIKLSLRKSLYERIEELGTPFITGHGSGALLSSLSDGIETIGKYYTEYIPAKALMMALPLSILLFVFPIDWISGLIMALTAPLIPVFMIIIGKRSKARNQKQWQKLARMSNYFLDVVQGLPTLTLFNAAENEKKAIAHTADEYRRETMNVLRIAFLSSMTLEFFSIVSIAIVAIFIGFRLIWGEIDFLSGFFVLLLVPEFYLPLRKMGSAYHAKMEALGASEKIMSVWNATQVENKPLKEDTALINARISIGFQDVSHSYDGQNKALDGVSFDVAAGQKIALVGASGAGKSTIMSLVLGFISPDAGDVFVNDTLLSRIDKKEWRQNIGWIPQNPKLFYGSVIDNIRMAKQHACDEEIISLCRKLQMDDFIKHLPHGYNTIVGEKGYGLSGGQIQRVSIARAFLRDAPVLLMDEPAASLDTESEDILSRAVTALSKDKTVITIAHRLRSIKNADIILFLKDGKIIDKGTHYYLTEHNADYARLVAHAILSDDKYKEAV